MATKKTLYLSLEDVIIPSQSIGRRCIDFQFAPSRITSLADATEDVQRHEGRSHAQLPQLEDVDYKKVKYVGIIVEGYGGFGGCGPILSKQDYEELRKRCMVTDNNDMIGQVVTVVYKNNTFTGFIAPNTYSDDWKRLDRRKARKSK